jgi:hypothetical protein
VSNWKIPAWSAGFAFILSLVSGLAGGVSLGVLLLRAILAAVMFSGFILGLLYLVERFLPDLAASFTSDAVEPVVSESGSEGIDIVMPEEQIPEGMYTQNEESIEGESLVEEAGEFSDLESTVRSFEHERAPETLSSPDLLDGLDSLPDLESFADSFVSPEPEVETEQPRTGTRPSQKESFDPETIARAVQTVLKKDREGKGNYGR